MPVERSEPGDSGFRDCARNDEVEDPRPGGEHRDITLPAHPLPCPHTPCAAAQTTPSCCAQSQHPEMPVERSEPGDSGFRDCARNDEVEDPRPGGEHRDITLPAHPLPCPHTPCAAAQTTPSCCAQSQHPEMPVERSEPGDSGFRDCARNDEVEDPRPGGEHLRYFGMTNGSGLRICSRVKPRIVAKEIQKIQERIGRFQEVKKHWEQKTDIWT